MQTEVVNGDLLDQRVDVIVNAWNRNVIPWWLLWVQGVAGSIKRRSGSAPFRELAQHGPMPLGGAVLTGAGRLPHRGIIHVAGINLAWRSSERSVHDSVISAMKLVNQHRFASVAFPVIGAGSGLGEMKAQQVMLDAFKEVTSDSRAVIVRYVRGGGA